MKYNIPIISDNQDLEENLKNIEKVIDDLNSRRDSGLDQELLKQLKKQLLISQVYHSNAIEGNKLSLRETELILEGMVINERPLKDEIEAKSLANATDYLYKLIDGREPLTRRSLLELHGLIMKDIPGIKGGAFRQEDVKIKESSHVPLNWGDIEEHIDNLFKWQNRNAHKYHPLVMGAILHHWLTWIHPFSDGNGRVSRMFLNFYLLQKGYPEVVIKIGERDKYYNGLINADDGDITDLTELLADSIRDTINIYEELLNEDERRKAWRSQYKELSVQKYEQAKETHSYQYEVWKNQIAVFRTLLEENVKYIKEYLPHLDINMKFYDVLSFNQYLDILEDRKVSNTWYISLRIFDLEKKFGYSFVFYFERFHYSVPLALLGTDVIDERTGRQARQKSKPDIKLYITARKNQQSETLDKRIDLVNIGTWGDQLSFGIKDRKKGWNPRTHKPRIKTIRESPGKIIRHFIDQVLQTYFHLKMESKFEKK